jgi:hypothetical protein
MIMILVVAMAVTAVRVVMNGITVMMVRIPMHSSVRV